jgi:hypothetical protein
MARSTNYNQILLSETKEVLDILNVKYVFVFFQKCLNKFASQFQYCKGKNVSGNSVGP